MWVTSSFSKGSFAIRPRTLGQVPAVLRRCSPKWRRLWRTWVCANGLGEPAQRLVFLGTPAEAQLVLARLAQATGQEPTAVAHPTPSLEPATLRVQRVPFQVVGVLAQPPSPQGRSKTLQPCPTHAYASDVLHVPVWTPERLSRDEAFLRFWEEELRPDLAITAAYGQILPERFLRVPRLGVLNIHPSLLPRYRGAAPVQRALLDGVDRTGVSIVRTVLELDAGPILCQEWVSVDEDIQAPELLRLLFELGTQLLIERILSRPELGQASSSAELDALLGGVQEQDHSQATYARKLEKHEGELSFGETALFVHNRVRALVEWPGVWTELIIGPHPARPSEPVRRQRLKVLRTRLARREAGAALGIHTVDLVGDAIRVTCDDGSQIDILELQLPGKRAQTARAFWNGLQGRAVERPREPYPTVTRVPVN
ncbi:Mitochondrial transcription factor 1 [Cyanidiococcus yangmingshanensis]|uniref:Methionyl-tRNA formyltransferase, mitochondrial n=1 Tax=Cyanidiococcus yangmingshanensis TaxID=2690220 RepID=A0A7J7IDM0_9RHOD|nr:Mitochondrial transcription factor 1 [Cyanidiococcus yangmingshanensis]